MGKGVANLPTEEPPLAGIEDAATADNNEAAALPLSAGYCRAAVTWIMEPANQFNQPAPAAGGKK
jgi:hypothetical protein